MKLFELHRNEDETGVSGTGIVAQGVIFDNGKVSLTWLTSVSSVAVYDSIEDVVKIHGHEGKTRIIRVLDYDREAVRGKFTNYQQDDIEGVDASMLAAGGNQAYMVKQRGWWAQLFCYVPLDETTKPEGESDGQT